jgi:hypothetical protein
MIKPPGFTDFFHAYHAAACQGFVIFTRKMLQNSFSLFSRSLYGGFPSEVLQGGVMVSQISSIFISISGTVSIKWENLFVL